MPTRQCEYCQCSQQLPTDPMAPRWYAQTSSDGEIVGVVCPDCATGIGERFGYNRS